MALQQKLCKMSTTPLLNQQSSLQNTNIEVSAPTPKIASAPTKHFIASLRSLNRSLRVSW